MELIYNEQNNFKILQLTDLHIGSKPHHEDDLKTFQLIDDAFSKLNPDLAIITGDLIWSDGVQQSDVIFKELLERFNKYNVPVAITYGNHDSEDEFSRGEIRALEKYLKNAVTKNHSFIVEDRECYVIEVYDRKDSKALIHVLYVMDSGADAPLPVGNYEWIHPEQVNWYRRTAAHYAKYNLKNNAIFMHIPIPEYKEASKSILSGECNETNDTISAPYINTGLFGNAFIQGDVKAFFAGHDHDNNFVGEHHGVQLIYGQVGGYQCYGDLERGARIITLQDESIETHTLTASQFSYEFSK
ncbi:metallophosphoesterase family protein [Viridibacillus arvi]|uniref:metallophosphoesterase family protein n=1 Tax=Viridibacillus arvi TaxID=263475 RepID=UPI00368D8DFA